MKFPGCSNALNVLVYRKQTDILNLIIDFDNKLEDLCVQLLMLNINTLQIQDVLHSDRNPPYYKNIEQGVKI